MAYWTDDHSLLLSQRRMDAQQAEAKAQMEKTTMKPLPEALRADITGLDEAKAWIKVLHQADLGFHFEDDATDCLHGVISQADALLVKERVAQLYALEWGPKPGLGQWYCPIGYLLTMDPFDAEQQAEGFLPGAVERCRANGLIMTDHERSIGRRAYEAPGRFMVHSIGAEGETEFLGAFDTPDEACEAHPALKGRDAPKATELQSTYDLTASERIGFDAFWTGFGPSGLAGDETVRGWWKARCHCYGLGFHAGAIAGDEDAPPYDMDSPAWGAWQDGYADAFVVFHGQSPRP